MPDNRFDFLEFDDTRPARPTPVSRKEPPAATSRTVQPETASPGREWRVVELIGSAGQAAGEFNHPAGLATDLQENLYVADAYNHRVQRISPDGLVTVFGSRGGRAGQFLLPRAMEVDPEFRMFILETGNHRVQVLDADGTSLRVFGIPGHGLDGFHGPADLCLGPYGTLLIADAGNRRVSRWRRLGDPMDVISSLPGGVTFRQPYSLAVDSANRTYVLDRLLHAVLRFGSTGALEAVIGGQGDGPCQFQEPEALAVDPEGRLFVADTGNHRLEILDRDGTRLQSITVAGDRGPLNAPAGIAVSARGTVYLSDTGNHRVFRLEGRDTAPV